MLVQLIFVNFIYFTSFLSQGCGHCKKAKPEFSKAAEHFQEDPKIVFAAVDCTIHQSLCSAHEVKGYPTIKYYSYYSKVTKPYNGGRTVSFSVFLYEFRIGHYLRFQQPDFISYMSNPEETKMPPPISEEWNMNTNNVIHLNDNTFKKEIVSKEPTLVMFYAPCMFLEHVS